MRNLIFWIVLAAILLVSNGLIVGKERVLSQGRVVRLELAPRDPRSLLQGDYMTLRYRLANEVNDELHEATSADGRIVIALAPNGVATFVRFDDGSKPVTADEQLLRYRKRGEGVRIATDAFFFQEGQGRAYARARYGELRVDSNGDAVLVGLLDQGLKPLAPDDRAR